MIGETLSHYKIIEKLGEGGMGVVYKARDTKLDRFVALKFLPSHLIKDENDLKRFVQEAKAAAALNHPNVCTIHEIHDQVENPFIVMEYVEGETLQEFINFSQSPSSKGDSDESPGQPLKNIVDITVQIAEALRVAHARGIVHRDIKSENIMITHDGRVKVMDFGLASVRGSVKLTKNGSTVGTAAYMSPEQARGEKVDHRSDIWSLGVVLYEMLTGRLPFKREYEQAVFYSILHDEPEMPEGIPSGMRMILNRCFEKIPTKRFQKAGDFIEAMNAMAATEKVPEKGERPFIKAVFPMLLFVAAALLAVFFFMIKPYFRNTQESSVAWSHSIAVLPFADMSPDQDQEFFCDGMAEEILHTLTHVGKLQVIARTSAFAFKGKNMDVREIGKQLGVETLMEGSVRKSGDRLRVTVELIRTADGVRLWSNEYNKSLTDVFAIQEEIALAIVDQLKIRLMGGEQKRVTRRLTENLEAYHEYLHGRHILNRRKAEDIFRAITHFEKAIELDSLYVMGYVGLADAYELLPSYADAPAEESYAKAKEFVHKALEIDAQTGEAYASLGWILMNTDWDWSGAEKAFLRGMQLNPGYATLYHWYGYLCMVLRKYDKAIILVKRAVELDPLSPVINRVVGDVYYNSGQYEEAIPAIKRCLELEPGLPFAHLTLSECYLNKSMYTEALEEVYKEKKYRGDGYIGADYMLAIVYAKSGDKEKARQILRRLESSGHKSIGMAGLYFTLGEKDMGYQMFEDLYNDHDKLMIYINCIPGFDPIRKQPRFQALLHKMGFEP